MWVRAGLSLPAFLVSCPVTQLCGSRSQNPRPLALHLTSFHRIQLLLCEHWFWRMVNSHFAWNAHTHTHIDRQIHIGRHIDTQTDRHTHIHRILEPCACKADLLPWEQKPYPQPLSALIAWRLSHLGKVTGFILLLGSCCSQQGNPSWLGARALIGLDPHRSH